MKFEKVLFMGNIVINVRDLSYNRCSGLVYDENLRIYFSNKIHNECNCASVPRHP